MDELDEGGTTLDEGGDDVGNGASVLSSGKLEKILALRAFLAQKFSWTADS